MRKIGELPDAKQAGIFSNALYARGLDNDVETEYSGACSIWSPPRALSPKDELTNGHQIELLVMKLGIGPNGDLPAK